MIAVIILNHNKKDDVLECLESVNRQSYKDIKVIVVDNASTDDSVSEIKAEFPAVHLIENKINSGSSEGRNIGWRLAEKNFEFEYLLFLDDDVVLDKNFISKLVAVFNSNAEVGIGCGKAYTDISGKTIMSAGIRANLFSGSIYDIGSGKNDSGQFNRSGYVDACGAFGLMIRKDLFSRLGGFDKNYTPYGWEDVDLCLKAKKLGFYTYYSHEAVLVHKGTKLGRKPNPVYEKNKIKNYIYLLKTNTTFFQKIAITLCLPFRTVFLAIKLIFKGDGGIILEHFKGFYIGINNIRLSLKSNR